MTTRKKKNKIRDNTLTSLEKFNTTRKRDIMKGGTLSNNELAMNMSGGKLSSYAQAKDELITFINTKNLEIKLAQINTAKDLSATIDSDGTISNLGNGGSLYDAGLRQGDIILSYETKDTSNNIQKYAFIGDEKFLDTFKRTKISKISYITKDSIEKNSARANTILAELMEKIKQRIDAANESKIYIQYEHFTSTSQSITTPAQPANIATTATATGAATAPPIQPIATLPIRTTQQGQALEKEIIAAEAAIADKEKAIKYIEQTIESKKAQNEDPKVEEFELYALVAEKKALIANKDLLSETINGNDTAKINDLKKKIC
jgi:hypothetical protein